MAPADLPRLELRCLGAPDARLDGGNAPREVLWRTHFALLAYLALSPERTRSRAHLLGVLWPEKPEENARRSLNEAVRRLRVALGDGRLLTVGESLRLRDSKSTPVHGRRRAHAARP